LVKIVAEEEIIGQAFRDVVKGVGDKVDLVERSQRWPAAAPPAVNLGGEPA
jgi:hypothetical protein